MAGFKSKKAMATNKMSDFVANMTPEEARAFIRKVVGPERQYIGGEERDHLLMIFALLDPDETSNNQRTLTEVYYYSNKEYHVTYGFGYPEGGDDPLVELVIDPKL